MAKVSCALIGLAISLAVPIPAIAILLSGIYLRPDPIGDGYSLVATPFLLFGITVTPLAIFLYFESNERIRMNSNEGKFCGIEAIVYMMAILVLFANFVGTNFFLNYPLIMGVALAAPPILTLLAGFLLLRVKTTRIEAPSRITR